MALHRPRSHTGRILAWVLLIAGIVALVWGIIAHFKKPKPKPPPPTPVTAAEAKSGVVPIVLRGLGQVQAYNSYAAKSRVDGNITAIGYKEGSRVPKGALLVRVDPRPYRAALEQAEATQARDQAQLDNARLDLQRYAQLLPQGLTTKQVYDTQVATVRQLVASVRSDAAQVDQARVNLSYTAIRAPFAGRTGQRLVDIGNLVSAASQTTLVVLTQTHPIFVSFTLPELDLDKVVRAMRGGTVSVDAYDRDDQQPIAHGTLEVLDNAVDPGSGTVRLKARFTNDDERLWPGEFVNAHIVTAVHQNAITIPAGAVQMGPNGRFVFRIGPNNRVNVVPVSVSQIEGGVALIDSGLGAGDRIVVDGAFGLSAGEPVRVKSGGQVPPNQGPLDMTGRTAQMGSGPRAGGMQAGPRSESAQPQQTQPPRPATAFQKPQQQTPMGGAELQGNEGPGARTPLPTARQVPEPPRDKNSSKQSQSASSGH